MMKQVVVIKNIKRITAVLLCAVMIFSLSAVAPLAVDTEQNGTFTFANYNVAGLPSLNPSSGKAAKQKQLGAQVKADNYGIIAVQEDFGYDSDFYSGLGSEYRTYGSQNVVTSDGLNVFSAFPIYNVAREGWKDKGGMIWEGDIVSQKGFMYCVVEIAQGVYVDVYNLHVDAFGGEESIEARRSNFAQVREFIEKTSADRAVIVTGDFNSSFHFGNGEGTDLYDAFIEKLGLSDAWTEVINGGSFTDYSAYSGSYWGSWDSVEHVLYRSSGSLSLTALSHEYKYYTDDAGVSFSDHAAAVVQFGYTVTGAMPEYNLKASKYTLPSVINLFRVVYEDLAYVFSHFDEVVIMLKYANDIEFLYDNYLR